MARVFLSVHETSGDHGSAELVRGLRGFVGDSLVVAGLGGPRCEAAGVTLWRETTRHALHGIVEVAGEVRQVLRDIRDTAERVAAWRPDVCVLVDAPDYNIRLAKRLRRLIPDVPVVYFLCPQIWAWRIGRVSQLRRYFDKRLCIVPFEPRWYRQYYTDAEYIGHPAHDRVAAYLAHETDRAALRARLGFESDEFVVAVLPGSRGKEIRALLPRQLAALRQFAGTRRPSEPPLRTVIAGAPMREANEYTPLLEEYGELKPVLLHPTDSTVARSGTSYDAAYAADAALVCSGTASLETALLNCPQVIGYRLHWLTGLIGEILVQVRYASLVNLILGREAIPERLQRNCTVDKLARALATICEPEQAARIRENYAELRNKLGEPGAASRAAKSIATAYLGKESQSEEAAAVAVSHTAGWVNISAPLR